MAQTSTDCVTLWLLFFPLLFLKIDAFLKKWKIVFLGFKFLALP
jgi:hypothetical protein